MKAVKRDLLHPEVIETAAAEFRRLMAERTRTAGQRRAQLSRRLKEATAAAETLAEVIARRPLPTLIDKLERLEAERSHMLDDMKTLGAEEKVVTLHADAGALYRGAIERLESALERDDSLHVAEARESIRGIVMGVHIIPEPGRGAYHVELESDIARILLSDETRAMLGQRWVRGRAPPADLAAFSMPIRVSA